MKTEMNEQTALNRLKALCSRKEMCSFDCKKKLNDWGITDQESIIEALITEKYVNNLRYAESFVHDKFEYNKWGRIKITYQLKAKEISENDIQTALDVIYQDEYETVLINLLEKKLRELRDPDLNQKRVKLIRFAQSRGFEPDLIFNAVDDLMK